MGFAYNKHCYSSIESATEAFVLEFPVITADSLITLSFSPSVTVDGTIYYGYGVKTLSTNNDFNSFTSLQLIPCSVPDDVYDPGLGSTFWLFGFVGVLTMYFTSHVIGLVLAAVRRM